MISFFNILRIFGVILVVIYAYLHIFKNNENIMLLFLGIAIVIISSFFISMIFYKQTIKPYFINNNFNEIKDLKDIKSNLIKTDNTNIEYAFSKDDLSILKLNLSDDVYDNKGRRDTKKVFNGIYFRIKNIPKKPFSIANNSYFKQFLEIKQDVVLLDNVDFNKYFRLFTDDKIATFKYLTPKKLESISKNAKIIDHKISLFYKNNDLHIYLHDFSFSKNIDNEFNILCKIIDEF